jgi:hypothetical protein
MLNRGIKKAKIHFEFPLFFMHVLLQFPSDVSMFRNHTCGKITTRSVSIGTTFYRELEFLINS